MGFRCAEVIVDDTELLIHLPNEIDILKGVILSKDNIWITKNRLRIEETF